RGDRGLRRGHRAGEPARRARGCATARPVRGETARDRGRRAPGPRRGGARRGPRAGRELGRRRPRRARRASHRTSPARAAAPRPPAAWVAGAPAARVRPTAVVGRVVERGPAAVLIEPDAQPVLIDEGGVPFDASADGFDALPRLVLPRHVPRDRREPRLAAGLALARAVAAAGFGRCELELEGADPKALPVLHLAGLAPRVVLGEGAPAAKLARLRRALEEVPESLRADEIDLRFDDQVVLRSAPPVAGPSEQAPGADPTPSTRGPSG